MRDCESVGTFLGCAGDRRPLPFSWRGARLCRGCLRRELDPRPAKKTRT